MLKVRHQRADVITSGSKYAGMEVSPLRHLKGVEAELSRLKAMHAHLAREPHALRRFCRAKAEPGAATGAQSGDANRSRPECLDTHSADRTLGPSRSSQHYIPRRRGDTALIEAIEAHLTNNPGHGSGLLFGQALRDSQDPQLAGYVASSTCRAGAGDAYRTASAMPLAIPDQPTTPGRPTSDRCPVVRATLVHL